MAKKTPRQPGPTIDELEVAAYRIPTDRPEADGTLEWNSTTLVICKAHAGGRTGLGYTYADAATATLIRSKLAGLVKGLPALAVPLAWQQMAEQTRNLGRAGIVAMGIAAVDSALWDLEARLLDLPLACLLGRVHEGVPVYGSGGFNSYSLIELVHQMEEWIEHGHSRVKMKIGLGVREDLSRVKAVREAIGPDVELFVDANGAYDRKQALGLAEQLADYGVAWFEEPVSSDDLEGLRLLRDRAPGGMDIAAGEYGYDLFYFRRMLEAGAVDVLQADATRCGGITGFMRTGTLCLPFSVPLSAHTAPTLHLHPCCALPATRHIEFFHDHAYIEQLLFDGAPSPRRGVLYPDLERAGNGLEFKEKDAARYAL